MSKTDQRRIGFRQPAEEVNLRESSLATKQDSDLRDLNLEELKAEMINYARVIANCPFASLPDKSELYKSRMEEFRDAWDSHADALSFEGVGSQHNRIASLTLVHGILNKADELAAKLELMALCNDCFDSKLFLDVRQSAGILRNALREFGLATSVFTESQHDSISSSNEEPFSWTRE